MSFASLGLSEALAGAVEAAGYIQPTPVQQRAIPAVLQKRDLMVAAQTGTGKTGGFALPVLELLFPGGQPSRSSQSPRQARVLVLTPTRELAAQVHDSFKLYARDLPLKSACIFGGVGANPQVKALAQGVDVLVACPGRLLDLVGQNSVDLSTVEILVLDEADRMLDMGFIHDVRKVLAKLPEKRQNLLFSATFSNDIVTLAGKLLQDPERIEVTPPNTTVERIEQRAYRLPASHKRALLAHLITLGQWEQVLVFTRTKHGANRLAEYLDKHGLAAAAIHGNKSQNARTRALADFKAGSIRILVATDIAARGLDIDQLPHVVNFELPNIEEDYVHRIGRTGRAGRNGEAISLVAPDEEKLLRNIERLTRQKIPDGDYMGFDPATVEIEKKEVGSTSNTQEQRPNQESKRRRPAHHSNDNKQAIQQTSESDRTSRSRKNNNLRGKPRNNAADQTKSNDQHPAASTIPRFSTNRDPEEFLDDDIDNFGNRVDYVSPYQNKGRGRRSNGRTGATAATPAQATTPGGTGQHRDTSKRQPKKPNGQIRNGRNRAPERVLTPFQAQPREGSSNAQPQRTRQPVIVKKESKLERLPSLEQLEQLDGTPNKSKGEKPALLTRNH